MAELVDLLWSEYWTDRAWAALELNRIGWKPSSESEMVRYLIASRRWDELRQHGQVAADALIETAETLEAGPRPDPSLSQEDDVMEEHMELVEKEQANLRDELREIRHGDVRLESQLADLARDNALSSMLEYIFELGGKRGADCVHEIAHTGTAREYPSDLGFSAVRILSKHGDPRAETLLRSLICSESADPLLREFAMDEAGVRNHTGLLDLLYGMALDVEAEADIRLAAVKSIQKMAGPEAEKVLRKIQRSPLAPVDMRRQGTEIP
jgi:hypothetical protein